MSPTRDPDQDTHAGPSDQELEAAVPRDATGREVRVGIFVVVGIVSFLMVLFLLTDPATMRGRYNLVTRVPDAGGVRRGDPIQMRGVIIGRVAGFEMLPAGDVAITLELEDDWPIPVGSASQLGASGLFGGRTLEILPSEANSYHEEWDTLPGSDGGDGLMGSAEELSEQAGDVLASIDRLLDEGTIRSVQGSASEMEVLLGDLSGVIAEQRSALRTLTASLSRSAEGFERIAETGPDAAESASRAMARMDSTMVVLASASASLDQASSSLQAILAGMERGDGTLGRLAQDEALYVNLNEAAVSLRTLMDDIRENPGRYIRLSVF